MKYVSTRSAERKVDAAQAIVAGLSHEGGLYVPESFPQFSKDMIGAMADMTYAQRAKQVMGAYLTDYTDEEMQACVDEAYTYGRFDGEPAPVKKVQDMHMMELWHGPTHAFKDMALQMLPRLMTRAIGLFVSMNEMELPRIVQRNRHAAITTKETVSAATLL